MPTYVISTSRHFTFLAAGSSKMLLALRNAFNKVNQDILQKPFWQGCAEALLNFPALFSYWAMKWWVHLIDESIKSEIVKFFGGVHYPKKECYYLMFKKRAAKFKLFRQRQSRSLDFVSLSVTLTMRLELSLYVWRMNKRKEKQTWRLK